MKQSKYFLLLLVAFFYIGCDEPTQQANHSGTTSGSGSLFGFVNIIESGGDRSTDLSRVTVASDNGLSTTSDSTGRWSLPGLSAGIYTIMYSKPGYGTYIDMNRQFFGSDSIYLGKVTLAAPVDFSVSFDTDKCGADSNSIYITGTASGLQNMGFYRVLIGIGLTSDVSAADPNKYIYASLFSSIYSSSIHQRIFKVDLHIAGLASGTQAYLVMYPLSYGLGINYTAYLDQTTGKMVYTSLGKPSSVIPVTIP